MDGLVLGGHGRALLRRSQHCVAVWFDEPAYPIDAEYRAVLGRAVDALADAGAQVEVAHPPVAMAEQVALFMAMIGPAVSPSMPDDVAESISGSHLDADNIAWTGLIGIVGLPSAVPPLGPTASGLPVGVQVVAPYLHDHTAVSVAGLIADTVDGAGYRVPPGF